MRARRDAALRLLKTMLVASIVIPLAPLSYASWINYQDTIAHADEQLTASLNILSEHASKVFQSVDLAATSVNAIAGDLSDEQIEARQEALHYQLNKLEKALATVDALLLPTGTVALLFHRRSFRSLPIQMSPTATTSRHKRSGMPALMLARSCNRARQKSVSSVSAGGDRQTGSSPGSS